MRGKNQNEVINKITMQAFKKELGPDGLPIKNGLPKTVNETVTKNKEGLVEKKLVQIEGQTKVIEYLYDVVTGKVKAEIVGQVKNKQLIPESQVNKEYTIDSKGNEIVTDMNEHGTILKITNNGQQVAGLYGIPLDVIFNETLLLQILKDQSFDTMSASQREAKVNSIVEDVKKAIQDNVQQILNTDAVAKMSNYSELQVQQVVEGALNKFNQMYDSNINQFLKTSAEKFVKELPSASQPVLETKQQNQQQRSGLLLKQPEAKIKEQARKVAEDQKKNEIKQQELEKAAKQVESYTAEQNDALLIAYLTSQGIMPSPQAGAVYLKLVQDAEVQRLTDIAVASRTPEIKAAGDQAVKSLNVSSTSQPAPKAPIGLLDAIKTKNKETDSGVNTQKNAAQNNANSSTSNTSKNVMSELQLKLQARGS